METTEILYARIEQHDAAWAEITLNRPEKGNALTMPMLEKLESIVAGIESDRSLRAVVIRANGRFFCTGGDIEAWGALSPQEMVRDWILPGIRVFDRIASLPQPVIAVLSGHALGGGLELALAADLRIAVRSAKLGTPEVTLGMISGWMGVRRLAETIGVARARHMTLLGAPITAAQALEWGLVTALAEDAAGLEQQLGAWLAKLCRQWAGRHGPDQGHSRNHAPGPAPPSRQRRRPGSGHRGLQGRRPRLHRKTEAALP